MILIAQAEILYGNRKYQPGEILPADTLLEEAWLISGAAYPLEDLEKTDSVPKKRGKRVAARSGLAGTAIPGAGEENLVGRIPEEERRKR